MKEKENTTIPETEEEFCQRCGEPGPDLRTLFHSCFYAMEELEGVPFEQVSMRGHLCKKTGEEEAKFLGRPGRPHMFPVFAGVPEGQKPQERVFYLLRVCKSCRADWMDTIQQWFHATTKERVSTGTGVFIRERGSNRELTESEVAKLFTSRGSLP